MANYVWNESGDATINLDACVKVSVEQNRGDGTVTVWAKGPHPQPVIFRLGTFTSLEQAKDFVSTITEPLRL